MNTLTGQVPGRLDGEWATFPGGELQGKRPRALCPGCRQALEQAASGLATARRGIAGRGRPLCFQCYRVGIDRERALRAAARLDTASDERFQDVLPFEPVNRPRLEMLKVERASARTASLATVSGSSADRRRQAQIAARHAIQRIATTLAMRKITGDDRVREMAAAIHAAELQLPESWLPFVVSR
jgi:hypothetical protein